MKHRSLVSNTLYTKLQPLLYLLYSLSVKDEPTPRHAGKASCIGRTILYLHRPLVKFQQLTETFGFGVAKHPKKVIVVCLLLALLPSLGFLRFNGSLMTDDSFYPSHSLSKKHLENQKLFEDDNGIKEEIMIIANTGSNVLSKDCLQEALMVHKAVANITDYQTICLRSTSIKHSPCMVTNVFEVIDFDSKQLQNFSAVLAHELYQTPKLLSNGRTLPFLRNIMFSDFKVVSQEEQGYRFYAQAMKMIYFMTNPKNKTSKKLIQFWEETFETKMNTLKNKLNCIRIEYMTSKSETEIMSKIFFPNSLALCICFPVLFVFVLLLVLFSASKGGIVLFCVGFFFTVLWRQLYIVSR